MAQDSAIRDIVGEDAYDEAMNDITPKLGMSLPAGALYTSDQYDALMASPRVPVYVTDPADRDAETLWVGYNGMGFIIKCNEVVELPEPIAELLKNSRDSMKEYYGKSKLLIRSMDRTRATPWSGRQSSHA